MSNQADWKNPMGIQGPSPVTRYVQPGAEREEQEPTEEKPAVTVQNLPAALGNPMGR